MRSKLIIGGLFGACLGTVTLSAQAETLVPLGGASSVPEVATVSFWGRAYPWGYAWGNPYTYAAESCWHMVRVDTPDGPRWHRVLWCR
jgi:hypothetical protein